VKARLAQNRRTHPLFDMARFTEALEKAFTNAAG
jgi:predicted O-linked N-acetylglucosamine transferase (SPINDLY family)